MFSQTQLPLASSSNQDTKLSKEKSGHEGHSYKKSATRQYHRHISSYHLHYTATISQPLMDSRMAHALR
ncbi:hypothetical protein PVAP13_5NG303843 [Panicum virgatum]|uniref:Uncharacterized protein n=1 Tax=Panicum virgatum TaxID=38727 RepID=A0A8T0RX96_PANVG|nr:hypothetical protein PVAP13_5NG303843 [Panicum virgatum]